MLQVTIIGRNACRRRSCQLQDTTARTRVEGVRVVVVFIVIVKHGAPLGSVVLPLGFRGRGSEIGVKRIHTSSHCCRFYVRSRTKKQYVVEVDAAGIVVDG